MSISKIVTNSLAANLSLTGNTSYTGTLTGGTGVINIGSGQLYKDASGNVGIGTSSPNAPLAFSNAVATNGFDANKIRFFDNGTSVYGLAVASSVLGYRSDNHVFYTGAISPAERMRITADGNVGIGTSAPPRALAIQRGTGGAETIAMEIASGAGDGNTATTLRLTNSPAFGSSAGAVEIKSARDASGTGSSFVVSSSNPSGAVVERMRITSAGNVGIGTTSPAAALTIGGQRNIFGETGTGIQLEANSGLQSYVTLVRNTNDTAGPNFFMGKTRGTSLGSTTVVQANDRLGSIIWSGTDGSAFSGYSARINCAAEGSISANNVPGRLEFHTTSAGNVPTERMRITSSGNLLVGTTSAITGTSVNNALNVRRILSPSIVNQSYELDAASTTATVTLTTSIDLSGFVDVVVTGGFFTVNRRGYAAYKVLCNGDNRSTVTVLAPTNGSGADFTTGFTFAASGTSNTLVLTIQKSTAAGYTIYVSGQIAFSGSFGPLTDITFSQS